IRICTDQLINRSTTDYSLHLSINLLDMFDTLLHLQSFLRWVVLIFLIITLVQSFAAKKDPKAGNNLQRTSLILLIATHITFLIGLYLYFFGDLGFKLLLNSSFGEVMKNKGARFWAVEH